MYLLSLIYRQQSIVSNLKQMKNTSIYYLTYMFDTLVVTGSIEIVEEMDLRTKGPGKINVKIDFSKSKSKVSTLMKLQNFNSIKFPSESQIKKKANNILEQINTIDGIYNTHLNFDFDSYIATLSCDFKNLEALNLVIKSLANVFKLNISERSTFNSNAKRDNSTSKKLIKLNKENRTALNDAYFTYVCKFESKALNRLDNSTEHSKSIDKASIMDTYNKKATISANRYVN